MWWRARAGGVLLIPLVSWVTPANVSEGGLLVPGLHCCAQRRSWRPALVVADMGYLAAPAKQRCREQWHVAVVTGLRADMKLVAPFTAWNQTACPQGQPLEWLLRGPPGSALVWRDRPGPAVFLLLAGGPVSAAICPRPPSEQETLPGLLPLSTQPAQRLLQQVRPRIEPTQSFEKNQLGLSQLFLNSLRLTWCASLLADALVLLRALALLKAPRRRELLAGLAPRQTLLEFGFEDAPKGKTSGK